MLNTTTIFSRLIPSLLLCGLLGCASGDGQGEPERSSDVPAVGSSSAPLLSGRIALVALETDDSSSVATTSVVDGMLKQALDSIPEVDYVDLRQSGLAGASGVAVDRLVDEADLDGVIALRVARLGSVVGVDLRVVDPETERILFHDRAFSFIRYRSDDETRLLGPALYEAIYRLALRMGGESLGKMPGGETTIAHAQPLVVTAVEIRRDSSLGRILENRIDISRDGVRALGDAIRYRFPEFVVFDYESRSRLYELVRLGMVEDHEPTGNLERQAMYGVDVPYFFSSAIRSGGPDSVEFVVRLHRVTGPESDEVVDTLARRYESVLFETTTTTRDAIAELLDLSQNLLRRVVDDVRSGTKP